MYSADKLLDIQTKEEEALLDCIDVSTNAWEYFYNDLKNNKQAEQIFCSMLDEEYLVQYKNIHLNTDYDEVFLNFESNLGCNTDISFEEYLGKYTVVLEILANALNNNM